MCKRWSSFLIFDEWNKKFIQSETLQGFSRLYEACMNTWVAVVDINQGPLSFCLLSTHLHSLVCVQILLILLLWSLLELTLRDHTEHRNGNICFLFTWAAENGCFLCTWAPAAFDKADTWVSWTIQLQNHYMIIAEKIWFKSQCKKYPLLCDVGHVYAGRPTLDCLFSLVGTYAMEYGITQWCQHIQFMLTIHLVDILSGCQLIMLTKCLTDIHNRNRRHSHHGSNLPYHPYLTVCKSYQWWGREPE